MTYKHRQNTQTMATGLFFSSLYLKFVFPPIEMVGLLCPWWRLLWWLICVGGGLVIAKQLLEGDSKRGNDGQVSGCLGSDLIGDPSYDGAD